MSIPDKRPTIEDVARSAGVSNVTVSRVVNGEKWVSKTTRARVEKAMLELGYRPNIAARSMRSGRSYSIGFIMADLTNGFNALVAETAQSALLDEGYMMFVASSRYDLDRERQLINFLEERQVDGFLLSLSDDQSSSYLAELERLRVPFVSLDRDVPEQFDAVLFDHEACMRAAVEHLIAHGHQRIALFASSPAYRVGRARHTAFLVAMSDAGLKTTPALVRNEAQGVDYAFDEALNLLSSPKRPSAILATGNQLLFGVLKAVQALGLRIPEDVSVIGADEPDITDLLTPSITVLDRDIRLFAKTATELLTTRISGQYNGPGRRAMLPTRLIIRGSCGPAPY